MNNIISVITPLLFTLAQRQLRKGLLLSLSIINSHRNFTDKFVVSSTGTDTRNGRQCQYTLCKGLPNQCDEQLGRQGYFFERKTNLLGLSPELSKVSVSIYFAVRTDWLRNI